MLEHIGDACIKKLKDLRAHVGDFPEIVLPASIPDGKVHTVAHMSALVAAVENDKTAESKLFLKTLKLNDVRPPPPPAPPVFQLSWARLACNLGFNAQVVTCISQDAHAANGPKQVPAQLSHAILGSSASPRCPHTSRGP